MSKGKKIIVYLALCAVIVIGSASFALAQSPRETLDNVGQGVELQGDFSGWVGTVITGILGMAAIIFLIMVFYAGILWIFAQGDTTKIQKAKVLLIWCTLGVIVMFLAFAFTRFLFTDVLIRPAASGLDAEKIRQMEALPNSG